MSLIFSYSIKFYLLRIKVNLIIDFFLFLLTCSFFLFHIECHLSALRNYLFYFLFAGTLLCVVIVACNLFVTRVLCFIGRTRTTQRHMTYDMVNRCEKGSVAQIDAESSSGTTLYQHNHHQNSQTHIPQYHHTNSVTLTAAASPDEIKFAKLMLFLSISFVICWMPQMVRYEEKVENLLCIWII